MIKSSLQTCCFSTSIFSGFGVDFGRFWAPIWEPSSAFWRQKLTGLAHWRRLKNDVFKKWCLGGLRARFWRPRGSILEGSGTIFSRFSNVFGMFLRSDPSSTPSSLLFEKTENLPRSCRAAGCLPPNPWLLCARCVGPRIFRNGGAAVVPLRGCSIRRPTEGVATAC